MMAKLDAYLRERGLHTTLFFSPLFPESQIEHVYAKEIDTFFTIQKENASASYYLAADLDAELDQTQMDAVKEEYQVLLETKKTYLDKTIQILANNKSIHDQLETNFIPYIDFEGLNNAFSKLLP